MSTLSKWWRKLWQSILKRIPGVSPKKEPKPTSGPVPIDPPPNANDPQALDLDKVVWLHTNVKDWKVTKSLSVSISGSSITLDYGNPRAWQGRAINGKNLNANPWVFVLHRGIWYAATWEWMRYGQIAKSRKAVAGDHIKKSPLREWRPKAGEPLYFMVSGLARTNVRNVHERSNIVRVTWPG